MSRSISKGLMVCAAALTMSACASGYYEAQKAKPPATGFAKFMFIEYNRLAEFEASEYDWADAGAYGDRALAIAAGKDVQPEEISARRLPAEAKPELEKARAELVDLIKAGARDKAGIVAARAQGGFDCWMEQQEENHQPAHIKECKEQFEAAMKSLRTAMAPPKAAAAPAPAPAATPAPAAALAPIGPWNIYFDFDSAEIGFDAQLEINKASAAIQDREKVAKKTLPISVIGHTDTAGSAEYNLMLSQKRAAAVAETLEILGFKSSQITATAVGKDKLAVQTGDGQREPKNRRVEILVGQ